MHASTGLDGMAAGPPLSNQSMLFLTTTIYLSSSMLVVSHCSTVGYPEEYGSDLGITGWEWPTSCGKRWVFFFSLSNSTFYLRLSSNLSYLPLTPFDVHPTQPYARKHRGGSMLVGARQLRQ